jgi:hypothetical protein
VERKVRLESISDLSLIDLYISENKKSKKKEKSNPHRQHYFVNCHKYFLTMLIVLTKKTEFVKTY